MDRTMQEQVAAARYALIAPIVSRQTPLLPGELRAWLEEAASRTYDFPGSMRKTVSIRTLERYLAAYRKGGWEALKPKGRPSQGRTRLDPDILEAAKALRRERPQRSVEQIVFLLEEGKLAPPGTVAPSTLARHLRQAGLSRRDLIRDAEPKGLRRFEAEDILVLLQADFKHFVYLPDPHQPKKRKKVILLAILDDYSRYIVWAQFYWDEQLPRLEDSLKKAILRHGIPETFYCDNGAAFSAHHLQRICGKLGIRLVHSRPFRPMGRGKIERFFQFVDTSFRPEVYAHIEQGKLMTLEELNDALWAWLDGYYHDRVHGSTKQTPRERFSASSRERKRCSLLELNDIFLWEEERVVDQAGCVRLSGNTYEVDGDLAGRKVRLRYDPFDLSLPIQVWFQDKRYADARPFELKRKRHKRANGNEEPVWVEEADGQLSFLDLAQEKRKEAWKQEELRYADTIAGGRK